jgi:hypothetical protein
MDAAARADLVCGRITAEDRSAVAPISTSPPMTA